MQICNGLCAYMQLKLINIYLISQLHNRNNDIKDV